MLRVAAAKGYEATTVKDVIEVAGVSEQTFEQMFGDKESLLPRGLRGGLRRPPRPHDQRLRGGRRAALAGADLRRARRPGRAALDRGRHRPALDGRGDRRRRRRPARYRSALARFTPFLEEGRQYASQGEELPADTARFAIGGAASMIFDEIRAGRGPELTRILPDLVFAVLMPYLGPEAAEDEMRRVAARARGRRPGLDALAVAALAAGEAGGAATATSSTSRRARARARGPRRAACRSPRSRRGGRRASSPAGRRRSARPARARARGAGRARRPR